ncbi:MAG: hypothetical protein V1736_09445 [Pseudomonadota bacterium]
MSLIHSRSDPHGHLLWFCLLTPSFLFPSFIDFQIKLLGALSVGDLQTGTIPSLLPSQKHYLKVYG